MKYHSVSWKQLHDLTYLLAKKIQGENRKHDLIVGIARGGLTISHIASDFLKLPVASFTISSYKDLKRQELSDISYHVGGSLKNMNILLIDDISDTGKTFIRGVKYLKELGATHITTAAPFIRQGSDYEPNFYVKEMIDEWVVFPYDIRETVEAIQTNLSKSGKTINDISKQLSQIKIPKRYVARYLKI